VVVPTIRPEVISAFCEHWVDPSLNVSFIFVHDAPEVPPDMPDGVTHLCWGDIDAELGERRWIIPRMSDCVRSFGFLHAKWMGANYICSMDDDCLTAYNTPELHWRTHLNPLIRGLSPTYSTTGFHDEWYRPRGLPSEDELGIIGERVRVGINHGLWDGVLDRSARDEQAILEVIDLEDDENLNHHDVDVVPRGFFYPMCGMNVCFDVDLVPAMYFTLQGHRLDRETGDLSKLPYDRWGDIWAGAISKVVCDILGYAVTTGVPHVFHSRRSNLLANLEKEEAGHSLHPLLVREMLQLVKREPSIIGMRTLMRRIVCSLAELADELPEDQGEYVALVAAAIEQWVPLTMSEEGIG